MICVRSGEMGVKFLGRASGIWYVTMDDEEHFRPELAEKCTPGSRSDPAVLRL